LDGVSELEVLSSAASALPPRTVRGLTLPRLLFFTDPARVPDPEAVAEHLPPGSAVVFRAFGAADAVDQGRRLRAIAAARDLFLLVGAHTGLAEGIGAHGVHLPERMAASLPRVRAEHPRYLVTVAAHDLAAVQIAERSGADAAVVSPVFPSNSPSAGQPLGVEGLMGLIATTTLPIYALGGVRARTVDQLSGVGIAGIAAVEALAMKPA